MPTNVISSCCTYIALSRCLSAELIVLYISHNLFVSDSYEAVPVKYIDKEDELHGSVVGSPYVFSLLVSNFVLNSRLLCSDEHTELDHVL